jgi:hypothetical protein
MIRRKFYKWIYKKLYLRICNIEQGFLLQDISIEATIVFAWKIYSNNTGNTLLTKLKFNSI